MEVDSDSESEAIQTPSTDIVSDNEGPPASGESSTTLSQSEQDHGNLPTTTNICNENSSKRKNKCDDSDDDDGSLCPICLDNWTNSGEHRICSLKCGHLFCYKCVVRWLDSQQQKSCPTCKKKTNKHDIRYIYAKKLIAVDNSEMEALRKQLNLEIEEKHKIQLDLSKYICREGILKENIVQLQNQIQDLSNKEVNYRSQIRNNEESVNTTTKLYMEKSLEICRQNGCRVFDCCINLDMLMVSAKSPNNLFSGYGIRKVDITQFKPLAFIPLHQQQIRAISFHSTNNMLLTASMDKTFKVVGLLSNKVVFSSSLTMPLWSCCWDKNNQHHLYVGTQSGSLVQYDVRSLSEPVCTLSIPGDMSPVVSVASVAAAPGSDLPHGGVICCKLNSMWVFENKGNYDYLKHSLSLNGPFVSMKHHNDQLLVSCRPNNLIAHSRHLLGTLAKNAEGGVECNVIHTFSGGGMQKLLSKSCFVSDKQDYVAAYEESNKSVFLWSINTGQKACAIPAHEAVLDLRGISTSNGNFVVSLTERKMEFFKFT